MKETKTVTTKIKGLMQQEDKTFVNIYAPSVGEPRYIQNILWTLRKTETVMQACRQF